MGDSEIENCKTEIMTSEVRNKPRKGKYFRVFRGELMNVPEDYNDKIEHQKNYPILLTREHI